MGEAAVRLESWRSGWVSRCEKGRARGARVGGGERGPSLAVDALVEEGASRSPSPMVVALVEELGRRPASKLGGGALVEDAGGGGAGRRPALGGEGVVTPANRDAPVAVLGGGR